MTDEWNFIPSLANQFYVLWLRWFLLTKMHILGTQGYGNFMFE